MGGVTESGTPAHQAEGVTYLSSGGGKVSYRVGAGTYRFRSVDVPTD